MTTSRALARFLLVPLLGAASAAFSLSAAAQDRPTLSGSWSASAMTESWSIGEWGDACGPKPSPHGSGGGAVQVSESGGELVFSGGGYPRTSGCFEMGGGIGVSSHTAAPRGWRTRCATAAADPRKATIVTTITASDTLISFDETGQYQFILKEQNCTASVRRTRSYSLLKRQGEEPPPAPSPAVAAPPADTAPPRPAAAALPDPAPPSCASPGDPARVEIRPARKLMKPGESFSPRGVVLDASGCRVAQYLSWSTPAADGKVTVSPAGLVAVAADAAEGEYPVLAGVSGKAARMVVEVVSPERYAELLAGGSVNSSGENEGVAVAIIATRALGGGAATAEDPARKRKALFLGVVGVCVLALGAAGLVWLRRARPETEEVEEFVPGETRLTVVRKKRLVAKPRAAVRICPNCGRSFPPGVAFCPDDGGRLGASAPAPPAPPAAPGAAPLLGTCPVCHRGFPPEIAACPEHGARLVLASVEPRPPAASPKICPACGAHYPGNIQFCGKEGATLVLAN